MADDDQDRSRPNLEPPKLFGRKPRPEATPEPEPEDGLEDELELPPVSEPPAEAEPTTESITESITEPPTEPPTEPTEVLPVSDPTWMFEPPEPEPEAIAVVLPAEAGTPLFADEVEGEPAEPKARRRAPRAPKPAKTPRVREPKVPRQPRARRVPVSGPALPTVSGWVAAAATGVVIGLLMVGMTAGSLKGCEAVRGTSTCGGSGVVILVLIMAFLVVLGGFLLRLFDVPDAGSTSFLAVGMVAVIALLFLLDVLENWWTILVIPAISVAMYLLAYWVTTAFVEPATDPVERRRADR